MWLRLKSHRPGESRRLQSRLRENLGRLRRFLTVHHEHVVTIERAYGRRFFAPLDFEKWALPRPVPIVRIAQFRVFLMKGTSLRPCTTASLCITTEMSWSPMEGISSRMR